MTRQQIADIMIGTLYASLALPFIPFLCIWALVQDWCDHHLPAKPCTHCGFVPLVPGQKHICGEKDQIVQSYRRLA